MADGLELNISGLDDLSRRLESIGVAINQAAADALRAEAEIEMTEAKKRTPVLTGALRASGFVDGPDLIDGEWTVTMQFGGPSAPYAVFVHENLESFHKVGQAKFLESVLLESAPYLAQSIATRIAKTLGG